MDGVKNKSGLTTIASTLIIIGMVVAIGIVFIIIYNIISSEVEYYTESNISLQIEKSSVVIGDDSKVSLKVSRGTGDAELEKIKFVLFDGENIEEIEKKASDLKESSEMSFSFTPKLVTNIKTISVVPIIKVAGKRKYLAVANSITITKQTSGNVTAEIPTTTCGNAKQEAGEQCDDGNLFSGDGCSSSCKTEVTTTTADCGNGVCNGTETCSSCSKDCGVCSTTSLCGNSVKDSGEECDLGSSKNTNTACSTTYGMNCSYCTTSCKNTTVTGSYCGDNTCNSPTETSTNCIADCPLCTAGNTQSCGTTDVGECAFGTQTCSAAKTWGACTGEVTAVAETCDGKDNDCDALIDESLTTSTGCVQLGYCSGAIKTCTAGAWSSCSKVPATEICSGGVDEDCDGSVDCADSNCNGQTCDTGKICSGGSCGASTFTLTVLKSGSGTVASSPSGINCGSDCSESYNTGISVTLTATRDSGYSFSGWGGACSGISTTCSISMTEIKSVNAIFSVCTATHYDAYKLINYGEGGYSDASCTIGDSNQFTFELWNQECNVAYGGGGWTIGHPLSGASIGKCYTLGSNSPWYVREGASCIQHQYTSTLATEVPCSL